MKEMNLLRENKWKTKPTEKEKADARKEKEKDGENCLNIYLPLPLIVSGAVCSCKKCGPELSHFHK